MRLLSRRPLLVGATALLAFGLVGLGVAMARATHRAGPFATGGHRGLTVKKALPATRATSSRVIVVLKNQYNAIPATRRKTGTRIRAEKFGNARIMTQVKHAGGRVYRQYHALNAFAANVSASERSALQRDSAVKQVIPDTVVALPGPITDPGASAAAKTPRAASPATTTPNGQTLCPADPSKPLLEPEALQTTHTAFDDPSTPQAQNLATGTGVKVAFFADGLDINNPDSHPARRQRTCSSTTRTSAARARTRRPARPRRSATPARSPRRAGQVYDLSQFVNPAHPLPPGCNITVRGVAPGAIADRDEGVRQRQLGLQLDDHPGPGLGASTHDHADVFSESFGGYPIPDSAQDLTRQFNEQAVAAGVTVVESTGDSGVEASPSSAVERPVRDRRRRQHERSATTPRGLVRLPVRQGLAQRQHLVDRVGAASPRAAGCVDLVAPGEANWALCTPEPGALRGVHDFKQRPAARTLQSFGGTSQSAPLIAGGAALVIQAYRGTHGGRTPSPALVKPAADQHRHRPRRPQRTKQGAGEIEHARTPCRPRWRSATRRQPNGSHLLVGPTQLDSAAAGRLGRRRSVKVTNIGATTQIVHAHGARDHDAGVRTQHRIGQPERRPARRSSTSSARRGRTRRSRSRSRAAPTGCWRSTRGPAPDSPRRDDADRPERQLRRVHPPAGRRQPRRGRRAPSRSAARGRRSSSCATERLLGDGQLAVCHPGLRLGRLAVARVAVDRSGQDQDVPAERQDAHGGR